MRRLLFFATFFVLGLVLMVSSPQNECRAVEEQNSTVEQFPDEYGNGNMGTYNYLSPSGNYVIFESGATNFSTDSNDGAYRYYKHKISDGSLSLVLKKEWSSVQYLTMDSSDTIFAFVSSNSALVAGDTNNASDIFLYKSQTDTIKRIVASPDPPPGPPMPPPMICDFTLSMSGDGRFVVFSSSASNLIAGDTNSMADVFLYDDQTETLTRINLAPDHSEAIGGDFGGDSGNASISADGRYIVFESSAINLVAGDTNNARDVFVYDRQLDSMERVSVATDGSEGNSMSSSRGRASISSDGRYVVFDSSASNLVAGDVNNQVDIFLRDRQNNTTEIISKATGGTQGDGESYFPNLTSDGRYIVFWSNASNLVAGDTNARKDVFVRDRQASTTERVSVNSQGGQSQNVYSFFPPMPLGMLTPGISSDGRYVAYFDEGSNLVVGDNNSLLDGFLKDRQTGTNTRVTQSSTGQNGTILISHGSLRNYAVTSDGRYVVFSTWAVNLDQNDTNNLTDVYLYDKFNSTYSRVSLANDGSEAQGECIGPTMSPDTRYIVFTSNAANLVAGDNNSAADIFLRDRTLNTTERVSLANDGSEANWVLMPPLPGSYPSGVTQLAVEILDKSISSDGRYVAFASCSTNLVAGDNNSKYDVFVRDRQSNTTERISVASDGSEGDSHSVGAIISADGRYVCFVSEATNLVAGDTNNETDIFVRDRQTNETKRVNVKSDGTQSNGQLIYLESMTPDGKYILFSSKATNLVADDTNNVSDLFLHDTQNGTTVRISTAIDGTEANNDSSSATISADGRYVAFWSAATNLVTGGTGGIYRKDLQGNTLDLIVSGGGGKPYLALNNRMIYFYQNEHKCVSYVDHAPIFTSSPTTYTVQTNIAFMYVCTAADPDNDAFAFSAVNIPNWLSFDAQSGRLAGATSVAGTYSVTLRVKDIFNKYTDQSFPVTVTNPETGGGAPPPAPCQITTTTIPSGKVGTEYSQTLTATGNGEYAWSYTGTLPAGITLSSAGVISGKPTVAGDFSFTVNVTDKLGQTAQQAFTLKIEALPTLTITTALLPPGEAKMAYITTLTAQGGLIPYSWTLENSVSLPSGLSLSTDGVISGTPDKSGIFNVAVKVTDGVGATVSKTLELFIADLTPPKIIIKFDKKPILITDSMSLSMTISGKGAGDIYAALILPDGVTFYTVKSDGTLSNINELVKFDEGNVKPGTKFILKDFVLPAGFPVGNYTWLCALVAPGGNVMDSAQWLTSDQMAFEVLAVDAPKPPKPPKPIAEYNPPAPTIEMPKSNFNDGEEVNLDLTLGAPPAPDETYDVYLVISLPGQDSNFICLQSDLTFGVLNSVVATAKDWTPMAGKFNLLKQKVQKDWPRGIYIFHTILVPPGMDPKDSSNWVKHDSYEFILN